MTRRAVQLDLEDFVPALRVLLFDWLPRQPWFDATDAELDDLTVIRTEVVHRGWPLVMWVPVEVEIDGAPVICQTVLAVDSSVPDEVSDRGVLGEVMLASGPLMVFDALDDPRLATLFVDHVAGELSTGPVRSVSDEPWLSVLELGSHWEMLLYRRVEPGPHPDSEIPSALAARDCSMVIPPRAVWRKNRFDLATVRRRVRRGVRGDETARISIEELLTRRVPPRESPFDIAHECFDLGQAVAAMHVASATHFGVVEATAERLVTVLADRIPRQFDEASAGRIAASYARLACADDLGVFIRVHGNLRLGSAMHERQHWTVSRFGCDPDSLIAYEREEMSPLCDLASMVHDVAVIAQAALDGAVDRLEQAEGPDWEPDWEWDRERRRELMVLAEAWEERCVDALIAGYTSNDAVHRLLPVERVSRDALLTVFELESSVRDTVRRMVSRADLLRIPIAEVDQLSHREVRRRW